MKKDKLIIIGLAALVISELILMSDYLTSINALLTPVSTLVPPVKGHETEAVIGVLGVVLVGLVLSGGGNKPKMKKWAWRNK